MDMVTQQEQVLRRANARAQRRFHRMLVEQAYANPTARSTRLYSEAERLIDALLGEAAWQHSRMEWDELQLNDPEAPDYLALAIGRWECQ